MHGIKHAHQISRKVLHQPEHVQDQNSTNVLRIFFAVVHDVLRIEPTIIYIVQIIEKMLMMATMRTMQIIPGPGRTLRLMESHLTIHCPRLPFMYPPGHPPQPSQL